MDRKIGPGKRSASSTPMPSPSDSEEQEQEHGAVACYYNMLPSPSPTLECLCGFSTTGARTWEEAGAEFDEHLEEVQELIQT